MMLKNLKVPYKDLSNSLNYTPPKIPDYENMVANHTNVTNQEFNFNGGINIQECSDAEELVSGIIDGRFKSAAVQNLGKI